MTLPAADAGKLTREKAVLLAGILRLAGRPRDNRRINGWRWTGESEGRNGVMGGGRLAAEVMHRCPGRRNAQAGTTFFCGWTSGGADVP